MYSKSKIPFKMCYINKALAISREVRRVYISSEVNTRINRPFVCSSAVFFLKLFLFKHSFIDNIILVPGDGEVEQESYL